MMGRTKVTLDLSDWELAEWPEELWKAVEVTKNDYAINIEINASIMETAARKIIKQGIETYLNDATFWFSEKGLEVADMNCETEFVVPWDNVLFRTEAMLNQVEKMLAARRQELKDEEGD
jgi:hypothetical protein